MSEEKKELRKCSTCSCNILLETYFSKNRKGEYKKNCDRCLMRKRESNQKWRESNPQRKSELAKLHYVRNVGKIKEHVKTYKIENKEVIREKAKAYRVKHSERLNDEAKQYRKDKRDRCCHGIFKGSCRVCDPLGHLRRIVARRIHHALGNDKSQSSLEYLGCNISTFKEHIGKSFKEGMSWENHGEWEIDHIIPIMYKQDDVKPSLSEVGKRLHYTNTQALWKHENRSKYNSLQSSESESNSLSG